MKLRITRRGKQLALYEKHHPAQYATYRKRIEREQRVRVRKRQPKEEPAQTEDLASHGPHYAQYRITKNLPRRREVCLTCRIALAVHDVNP